jgi:hypothetical protein
MNKVLVFEIEVSKFDWLERYMHILINRKFRVTTEIGSTFFNCCSVTGQLKIKI